MVPEKCGTSDQAVALALIPDAQPVIHPVTPDNVLEALVEAPIAVISGHAVHSLADGGGIALSLGAHAPSRSTYSEPPGGVGWLTAEAVERLPLRSRQWAFLAACSSGQAASDLPDEAIGLPSAFRHAGFRTTVATLWPVKDHAAFVALARFLQYISAHPQDSVAVALRKTRTWLRTARRGDLLVWLGELQDLGVVRPDLAAQLSAWWSDCPQSPYGDPEDWAAYAATGH